MGDHWWWASIAAGVLAFVLLLAYMHRLLTRDDESPLWPFQFAALFMVADLLLALGCQGLTK